MASSGDSLAERSNAAARDGEPEHERIVNMNDMNPQQLQQIKQQAEMIMNKLTVSIEQLYEMKKEYVKAAQCVEELKNRAPGSIVLAPLAEGIYAKGTMPTETLKDDGSTEPARVLVDIGTGYIVEFTHAQALDHFKKHIAHVDEEVKKLQHIGQQKLEIRTAVIKRLAAMTVSNMKMPSINNNAGGGAGDAFSSSLHESNDESLQHDYGANDSSDADHIVSNSKKAANISSSTNSVLS